MGGFETGFEMRFSSVILALALFVMAEAATKKRRSTRDWDKIVNDEVDKMDKDEEEEAEAAKPPMPDFDPANMNAGTMDKIMAGQKSGKPAMVFVTVDTKDREATEKFAQSSRGLLKEANGIDAQSYVIEDDKILYSITDGAKGYKMKDILLSLPEVADFEWDSANTPGKAKESHAKKKKNKPPASEDKPPKDE